MQLNDKHRTLNVDEISANLSNSVKMNECCDGSANLRTVHQRKTLRNKVRVFLIILLIKTIARFIADALLKLPDIVPDEFPHCTCFSILIPRNCKEYGRNCWIGLKQHLNA